ncbi:vWA domain-containing protein [Actinomycetospora cinnamomea]|uniref:VWFA domain-containing protein n=1 Tax=Actinomycetospora cinnamomea TaxID=663609 RepID=A0A2U1FIF7_9PSEU|nr:VWA domain-containing protein [Actinomycetospora cinnamomea]PVZ11964.1 hypothetical protein C8D89_103294 [Actinomycetospora cinnamomea]
MAADLATLAARFTRALRDAGMSVDAEQATRFAAGVLAAAPGRITELYWVARVTLVIEQSTLPVFDAVFSSVFRGTLDSTDPADQRGDQHAPPPVTGRSSVRPGPAGATPQVRADRAGDGSDHDGERRAIPTAASAAERLGGRDFAELTPAELLSLSEAMRLLRLVTPPRPARRYRPAAAGPSVDLRATLRRARRTAGQPVVLARRTRRTRRRRLVVLCDISGSMEPYARALLQLLWCARVSARAEVFTFATRLTRLTPALSRGRPEVALARAAALAPDWSSGSRIGESLAEFSRRWGRRGMARGAVLLVVSDGWDTGDPEVLGREMARLRRVAHRIVWANPRTARAGFEPRARGVAAAWPHCDAVISAHRLDALDELVAALGSDAVSRPAERRRPR